MKLQFIETPSDKQTEELKEHFSAYANSQIPGLADESQDKVFMLAARDEAGRLTGGILANCYWDGLEIDTLWVEDAARGRVLGAKLVEAAEGYGIAKGAVISFLKTVEARRFYEKLGYEVYGVLEDRPIGTSLYHMKKRLRPLAR